MGVMSSRKRYAVQRRFEYRGTLLPIRSNERIADGNDWAWRRFIEAWDTWHAVSVTNYKVLISARNS